MLNLLDRPDLRSKFAQELARHLSNLSRFQTTPEVCHDKLNRIIDELNTHIHIIHANNGKFAHELRTNAFINSIQSHHATPGSSCGFNTPAYQLWLASAPNIRRDQLKAWLHHFNDVHDISRLLLRMTRDSGMMRDEMAPQAPCQLIRVSIDNDYQVFPRISVGRYGISIRFLSANLTARAEIAPKTVPFKLATCVI